MIIAATAIQTLFIYAIMSMPATMIGMPSRAYRLYLPVFVIIRPMTVLMTTIASDIGIVTYPAYVGEMPSTPCTKNEM